MSRRRTISLAAAAAAVAVVGIAPAALPASGAAAHASGPARHVLVLSVDGMHQSDLDYYVHRFPHSALAGLVDHGVSYAHASTTFPSDSFPGMVAQFTGATPGTSGVYYDDTYNHALLAPGTRDCSTAARGTEVAWTEAADRSQNPITLDAGQGLTAPALTNLPKNSLSQTLADHAAITKAILGMTPTPQSLLDPNALPVDPRTCTPIYPGQYLRTNTVFEVAHQHGLRTAWSDKHAAYAILDGRSGTGIDDLFTPEINSVADSTGDDWTTDNALTREYDGVKVAGVLNEIDGYDHGRRHHVGTPAILGMNFQSVSTAQKLPTSDGEPGGYNDNGTPKALLLGAMNYVDQQVGRLVARIHADGLSRSTTVILSAKHGQSPIDPADLRRVDDGAIIGAINKAWATKHPNAAPLVTFATDDDLMLIWLSDRSPAARSFVRDYLLHHSAPANTINDPTGVYSTSVPSSGLTAVYTGSGADHVLGAPVGDSHAPDVLGIVQHGVVYTGKASKIAEHGGDSTDDRHVPLVVSGAGVHGGSVVGRAVATTQIAPTILRLLGLPTRALQAVRTEHTAVLPRI